jgi:hypothetical protein
LINVRNPNAWTETDTVIPEAIRVPLDKLEESLSRIPKNKPAVTAPDQAKPLAPVWCRNFRNAGTKTCGRFRVDFVYGRVLDCQSSQNGRRPSSQKRSPPRLIAEHTSPSAATTAYTRSTGFSFRLLRPCRNPDWRLVRLFFGRKKWVRSLSSCENTWSRVVSRNLNL